MELNEIRLRSSRAWKAGGKHYLSMRVWDTRTDRSERKGTCDADSARCRVNMSCAVCMLPCRSQRVLRNVADHLRLTPGALVS